MSSKISNFVEQSAASVAAADLALTVDVSATTAGTKKIKEGNLAQAHELLKYFSDTGGDDAYVITTGLSLTALTAGMSFEIKVTTANTGAATLAVDSVGAINITKQGGAALATNDIIAGMVACFKYNGTTFELQNPASISKMILRHAVVTSMPTSSTRYIGLDGSANASIDAALFLSAAGTYKNLRVFVTGNAAITALQITLVQATAFSGSVASTIVASALTINAPASATGTLSEDTTNAVTVTDGAMMAIKAVTGPNGSYGTVGIWISYDFIPE